MVNVTVNNRTTSLNATIVQGSLGQQAIIARDEALEYANQAANSAILASNSATAASNSATAASNSAILAANSATAASNSAILAANSATAAATASASGVSISFLDFNLPVGLETKTVISAGAIKQEGATKDYTRLYDGFIETIRFAVAPGVSAWVQIQATKGAN